MEHWSAEILRHESTDRIVKAFDEKMIEGIDKTIIAEMLVNENCEDIQYEAENGSIDCRLGLAYSCWKYGVLTLKMLEEVKFLVESRVEKYERYIDYGNLNEEDIYIVIRMQALKDFIVVISKPSDFVYEAERQIKRAVISRALYNNISELILFEDGELINKLWHSSYITIELRDYKKKKLLLWERSDETYDRFELKYNMKKLL